MRRLTPIEQATIASLTAECGPAAILAGVVGECEDQREGCRAMGDEIALKDAVAWEEASALIDDCAAKIWPNFPLDKSE